MPEEVVLPVKFDLAQTMLSGQPPHFLWSKEPGYPDSLPVFTRKMKGRKWVLRQLPGGKVATTKEFKPDSLKLLRAEDVFALIRSKLSGDSLLDSAFKEFSSLRLTKSDEWETTVCFLCSMNNNIPRIRGMVQKTLGENGEMLPPSKLSTMDLRKMGFGYRSKYINETAGLVSRGEFDLQGVSRLSLIDARLALQELPGVGPKVADCILLYGFGKTSAFPQDVWVKRVMHKQYGLKTHADTELFAQEKWGDYAGYAQHYLFWHGRQSQREKST